MADRGDRREKPTQRRLQKAREEGQFLNSKDFVGGIQFVAFMTLAGAAATQWMAQAETTTAAVLRYAFKPHLQSRELMPLGADALAQFFWPLASASAFLVAVTFGVQLLVTKGGVSLAKLKPTANRLDPVARLRELPGRNIPATIQALLMLTVFGGAIYLVVAANLDSFLTLPLAHISLSVTLIGSALKDLFWKAAGVFALFGAVDLIRQNHRHQKEMGMSRQDIRDEIKESEGDPQIKGRIRRLRRDLLRQQMMKQVPTATAVIVNPTHYAVALRYEHGTTAVPLVVAKGRNHIALRIRELAVSHQVPLVENPPLAQALYKSVKVGQEIPPHLYRAVAEVLAYIYRLMNRDRRGGAGTAGRSTDLMRSMR